MQQHCGYHHPHILAATVPVQATFGCRFVLQRQHNLQRERPLWLAAATGRCGVRHKRGTRHKRGMRHKKGTRDKADLKILVTKVPLGARNSQASLRDSSTSQDWL